MRPSILLAIALVLTTTRFAHGDDKPAEPPPKHSEPRRLLHAIDLSAHKDEDFDGRLTLRLAPPHTGPDIDYYWGGECKGSKLTTSRISALLEAMNRGYAIEVPSTPIKHEGRVHMCIRSIRIIKP
jgi:hypothetical protein